MKHKQGETMFQVRQGDVFIQQLEGDIPANAKRVKPDNGRTILAYGEVTGHAHALPKRVQMFRMENEPNSGVGAVAYLVVEGLPATLRHEEHAPIEFPSGKYTRTIQREYHPEELRNVID